MAPKKAIAVEVKPLLGRPSNNLKMGIVGLPNVGKSTFFNAITNSSARAENFPFCTIDPQEGRIAVPDERFDWLCQAFNPKSKVPAFLSITDIAGLVKGAAAGEGLGNAFLSHIKAVDAIFHMVRAFSDEEVVHVEGDTNPIRDIEIIEEELRLKDSEFLTKQVEISKKGLRGHESDKNKKMELDTAVKALEVVQSGKNIRNVTWNAKEIDVLNTFQLLTAKSVVYLANVSRKDYIRKKNKYLIEIKNWLDENSPDGILIPVCADLESEHALMTEEEKQKSFEELKTISVLPKVIVTGYKVLQLSYFFTAGPDEVRAWTIRNGSKAPQAAGVIHTDFERGFIMAEVMKYSDLHELKTEAAVKAAGKYMQKGREYVVEDGDVIFFKFNVTAKKK